MSTISVKDAIITVAAGQFADLFREQFAEVTKDALKTFDAANGGTPIL